MVAFGASLCHLVPEHAQVLTVGDPHALQVGSRQRVPMLGPLDPPALLGDLLGPGAHIELAQYGPGLAQLGLLLGALRFQFRLLQQGHERRWRDPITLVEVNRTEKAGDRRP
jgi:hypothetical protein